MGRTVEDTFHLLSTMAGFDRRAPMTMRDNLPRPDLFRPRALSGVRIGWLGSYEGYLATEPGVLALCEQALADLEPHGVRIESIAPHFDMESLWQCWLTLRHWSHAGRQSMLEERAVRDQLKPEMIFEIEGSLAITAADITAASVTRTEWYRRLHELLERFDYLALPSAQVFPFPAELHWPSEINGRPMDTYHRWMEVVIAATLAGVPALNLPVGFDVHGRPMGMQILGPFGADRSVLELGLSYEQVTDYLQRQPRLVTTPV
jgi:amidase